MGFVREGLLRQRWTAKGVTYDTALYGCLSGELQRTRNAGSGTGFDAPADAGGHACTIASAAAGVGTLTDAA